MRASTAIVVGALLVMGGFDHAAAGDTVLIEAGTPGIAWPRRSAGLYAAEARSVNDLVFIGRFESSERDSMPPRADRIPGSEVIRCTIDSVLMGDSRDKIAVFSRGLGPLQFEPGRLKRGQAVLVRLTRDCSIFGRDCGDVLVIGEDGVLLSDHIRSSQAAAKRRDARPLRLEDIVARRADGSPALIEPDSTSLRRYRKRP